MLSLLQAKSLDGANPWCPAEPNLPWMLVSFPRDSTHCTTQLQKQLSTGGWWCWCHFSSCSENHCGRLFKWDQLGGFLEFFDLQVKIMRLFKNKQRCCSTEAGCCCEFGCTVCLSLRACVCFFMSSFQVIFDIAMMAAIVIWMVTVSWWVFR